MEESFSARVPKSSAEVHRVFVHDIKEVEDVGQEEQQSWSEKRSWRDQKQRSQCAWNMKLTMGWMETQTWAKVCVHLNKEDSQGTTTPTDNRGERLRKTKDLQCMMAHAHRFHKCFKSLQPVREFLVEIHNENESFWGVVFTSARSLLSRDKRLPLDTENQSGLQENVFGNQLSKFDSPWDHPSRI